MFGKGIALIKTREFQRFVIVGGLAFVIDFGLLNFFVYVLDFDLTILGFIFVPNLISTVIAIIFNFFAQKYWTFGTKGNNKALGEGVKFVTVHVSSLIIFNTIIFGILIQVGLIVPIAKIVVTAMQVAYSYFLYKFFVFKK